MSLHDLRLYLVIGLAIVLTGCIDGNQSTEPYNRLIWNRENALAGNGEVDKGPWFEWWYYKVILPDTGDAFYFVYGVVNPWDYDNTLPASRAYVGFGDFATGEQLHETCPVSEFTAAYDRTDITIASHRATDTAISGSLVQDGHEASWDITINRLWDFNAMGWGMFVPEMSNIYWYPAQAAARFSGTIVHDGRRYDFENVPGYQDLLRVCYHLGQLLLRPSGEAPARLVEVTCLRVGISNHSDILITQIRPEVLDQCIGPCHRPKPPTDHKPTDQQADDKGNERPEVPGTPVLVHVILLPYAGYNTRNLR